MREMVSTREQICCWKWSKTGRYLLLREGERLVSLEQLQNVKVKVQFCYFWNLNTVFRWVSKNIKKQIRSTVKCVDWHPNNVLIAVGACDFKTRVYSAHVKDVSS